MLNPDGVIVGNTNLSLAGIDLTTKKEKQYDFCLPEMEALR